MELQRSRVRLVSYYPKGREKRGGGQDLTMWPRLTLTHDLPVSAYKVQACAAMAS